VGPLGERKENRREKDGVVDRWGDKKDSDTNSNDI